MKNSNKFNKTSKVSRTVQVDDFGNWTCICGNTAMESGFNPCDVEGAFVEPTPEDWTTDWYVCAQCGRIIDQNSCSVVGLRGEL